MNKKLLTVACIMLVLSLLMQGAGLVLTICGEDMHTGAGAVSMAAEAPEVQTVHGIATAKYMHDDTADMVITGTDGRKWCVQEYICPLYTAVTLTVKNGEIIQAIATTDFEGARP